MPTAVINQSDVRLQLAGERLQVFGRKPEADRDEVLREIPLRDLDRLIISESVHFTTPALAAVLRAGVAVQVFSWSGTFLGSFLPEPNKHGLARLRQYRRTLEPEFSLQMSGRIVTAKLYNQRRVLQRLGASRADVAQASTPASSGGIPAARSESGQGPACRQTGGHENPKSGMSAPPAEGENSKSEIQSTLNWMDALFAPI